jgi:hypothetical protein
MRRVLGAHNKPCFELPTQLGFASFLPLIDRFENLSFNQPAAEGSPPSGFYVQ